MIIGYIIEVTLAFLLAFSLFLLHFSKSSFAGRRYLPMLAGGVSTFFDTAIFFSFSIQIASIAVLSRYDYGISTTGMGSNTVQITWATSQLVLLPLMLPVAMQHVAPGFLKNEPKSSKHKQLQVVLFSIVWLLSFYPFLSMMVENLSPSNIGNKPGDVIDTDEWDSVSTICTSGIVPISPAESTAMEFLNIFGSLLLCLFAVTRILWVLMNRHVPERAQRFRKITTKWGMQTLTAAVLLVLVPLLAIGQLWAILRLQKMQKDMANMTGGQDLDDQWTFGQVVAVTVFLPVIVRCSIVWLWGETDEGEDGYTRDANNLKDMKA
jgi:hypothetical protein